MTVEQRKRPPPPCAPPLAAPSPSFSSRARRSAGQVFDAVLGGLGSVLFPRQSRRRQQPEQPEPAPADDAADACSAAKRPRACAEAKTEAPAPPPASPISMVQRVYLRGRRACQMLADADNDEGDDDVVVTNDTGVADRRRRRQPGGRRTRPQEQEGRRPLIGKFTYRPAGAADGISVTDADAACLRPGEYLNDVIIDFYLKYVHHTLLTPEQRERTHVFNCFFYKRLTRRVDAATLPGASQAVRRHASVAKWSRRVDLFDKDFILVPINENYHWFLAVVCFPDLVGSVDYSALLGDRRLRKSRQGAAQHDDDDDNDEAAAQAPEAGSRAEDGTLRLPCILVFDSLTGAAARSPNVSALRDYLQVEWDVKRASRDGAKKFNKSTIRGFSPRVPQQPNSVDCGPYVLHYAEMLFKRPIREFTRDYFENRMVDWFEHEEIDNKRLEMQQLLVRLYQTTGPDRANGDESGDEAKLTAAG